MTKYLRRGGLVLISWLLSYGLSGAQDQAVYLNDMAFVFGTGESRGFLKEAMHAFYEKHQVRLAFTLLEETSVYQSNARLDEGDLLRQPSPCLTITTWHDDRTLYYRRHEVQLNDALAQRLPEATARQIVGEWLPYYADLPPQSSMQMGMELVLLRLGEYLDALPPPEEVPTVTFANGAGTAPQPSLGLDEFTHEALRRQYEHTSVNQADYPVAWKALPSGQSTSVRAQVDQALSFPPGVVFKQNGHLVATQPTSENHRQQVTLIGQTHEQEGVVEVYASGDEEAELVGQLNTISYDVLPRKLVLIVLDDVVNDPPYLASLSQTLQAIYAQAGVRLTVETQTFTTGWGNREVPLNDETSGLLSNYPTELKRVINDYRKEHQEEPETAYLFLAGYSQTGKLGYMPKKRPYGFVYLRQHANAAAVAKTVAHELGHGLFRLRHTFESYPALTKGSTDNLMDYGKGTRLHKYQWDLVHNPEAMLGWFQQEEENAYYGDPYAYLWKEINALTSGISYSLYQFNEWVEDSKRSIMSLFDFSDVELTSDEAKVYEILTAIREDNLASLSSYAAEEIITGQDLQLDEESYEKLIVYFLQTPTNIDIENYRTEDKAEEGYSLLIFSQEGKTNREVLRLQVASKQKEALVMYLFGEVGEEDTEDLDDGLHAFEKKEEMEEDDYVHISAVPEMPELKFIYADSKGGKDIKMRLFIEYKRDIRQDEDYFPSKEDWQVVKPNKSWIVDFGDRIRGGKATLEWKRGEEKGNFVFYIRGKNPTEQAVKNYITQQGYNTWFFTRLIRQESNYRQFNPPASQTEGEEGYGTDWDDGKGCPNWGPPHGWGLTQLDLLDEGQRPTAQELWGWKANVDRGHQFLSGEKWNIANSHITGEVEAVDTWDTKNPTDPIQGHPNQTEGGISYTHASSQSFGYDWDNLTGTSQSFLDAVWIKSYNGNSRGYYYTLVVPNREGVRPYWILKRTNSHNHNYVEAVSGRAE